MEHIPSLDLLVLLESSNKRLATYIPVDHAVLSSFHSNASRWFPFSLAKAYTRWVHRKGSTFSGTNRPSPGLYWDQFV